MMNPEGMDAMPKELWGLRRMDMCRRKMDMWPFNHVLFCFIAHSMAKLATSYVVSDFECYELVRLRIYKFHASI